MADEQSTSWKEHSRLDWTSIQHRATQSDATLAARRHLPAPHLHLPAEPPSFHAESPSARTARPIPLHHSLSPPTSRPATMAGPIGWVADARERARSPLSEGAGSPSKQYNGTSGLLTTPTPTTTLQTHRNVDSVVGSATVPSPPSLQSLSISSARSPTYSSTLTSPCFVHSHLDHTLSDFAKRDSAAHAQAEPLSPQAARRKLKKRTSEIGEAIQSRRKSKGESAVTEDDSATASEGERTSSAATDDDEQPSLTRQLAETAVSVREMSKQLGRARVVAPTQSVMIITKARDNHLIRLTRELALWLMQTPRNGRDRGLIVYVDQQLKKSKRFDSEGLEREFPDLARPLPRRYSRTSSSASLAGSTILDPSLKKMAPLSQLGETLKRNASYSAEHGRRTPDHSGPHPHHHNQEEGQLRYWTNEMCTKSPHLFDFVLTLGGDGTVLYASWLFQHVVPPVIPFALGSLGFLTNFDFSSYAYTLNHAIDQGIRVNLRMRFTCTVYRAIEAEENKKRRAVKSGKTGGIFMKSVNRDGWQNIESGGAVHRGKGKDKEIKCFVTRPAESFEVLNDLVVDRGPSPYVSMLELFGDDHHMTTVQADGLTVSTPTGSTAYSLSAGGSLVHPEVPALLITPICPHTLSFRPMLLPDSMELRICVPYNSRSTAWASFDGRGRVELRQGDHIKVTASQYPFPTVCDSNQSTDWFKSISRTLKWNERQRQKSFVVVEENKKPMSRANSMASRSSNSQTPQSPVDDEAGDESDDEEELEDEEEIVSDEEAFDIDDLSSENQTNASSPSHSAHDPLASVPQLHSPTSPQPSRPQFVFPGLPERQLSSAASSVAELNDNEEHRWHDPAPRPPKLTSRHSYNGPLPSLSSTLKGHHQKSQQHAPAGSAKVPVSALKQRNDESANDAPYFASPAGNRPRVKSRDPSPRKKSTGAEASSSSGYAFAVVGHDSDTSASDNESQG